MKRQNSNQFASLNYYEFLKQAVLMLFIFFLSLNMSFAQMYSFSEIKENFFQERPQTDNLIIRENSFGSIDDLILGTFPPLHYGTQAFYIEMLEKAFLEIQIEQVTEGATIWQIYNHGFVVKTPSVCLGFDLYDYFDIPEFVKLAELIDVYFISHEHGDHFSNALIRAVDDLNKPVVGPAEFDRIPVKMNAGDSRVISNLTVVAHDGLHSVPVRQFEVITPEGLKFLHTGDNQTSLTLPSVEDIDVLMLNAWINESGSASYISGIRNAINKVKPRVTLPGHILELGHLGGPHTPVTYLNVLKADNGELSSKYYVLGWGERYHFDNTSNDSIRPYPVQNLNATIQSDSILVSWDNPQASEDGDTASFYRIFQDDLKDVLMTDKQYTCEFDTIRNFNFRIYSYDDCGNQSETYAELNFTPPLDVNYPPRIRSFYPSNKDMLDVFAGAPKLFGISAVDFNGDQIVYNWNSPQISDLNATTEKYVFNISGLDSGRYQLTCILSDQQDSTQITWLINYHTGFAIVDNGDSMIYSEQGNWETSTTLKAYGPDCRYTLSGNEGDWAQFRFFPEHQGHYDLFEIIPSTMVASADVLYLILIDGLPADSFVINQNEGSGYWVYIASLVLQEKADVAVKVKSAEPEIENGVLFTDAVKFVYKGEAGQLDYSTSSIPGKFLLHQNYPNPFNPNTVISWQLSVSCHVKLSVYSLLGEKVVTLVSEKQKEGYHTVKWDARNHASGIYYYKLIAGEFQDIKKMILLR